MMCNCQIRGCTDCRREQRTERNLYECCPPCPPPHCNIYECPPPAPLVVKCCVCQTAERPGQNIWSCVPFASYSTYYGPTLGDLLLYVLNLLPVSCIAWLGIGHAKYCSVKTQPEINYEAINPKSNKSSKACKPPCGGLGDHNIDCGDDLTVWMRQEYLSLAQELANLKRLTCEGQSDGESDNRDLLQARNYVLDRLAEMLGKREEIEKKLKKKKQKSIC